MRVLHTAALAAAGLGLTVVIPAIAHPHAGAPIGTAAAIGAAGSAHAAGSQNAAQAAASPRATESAQAPGTPTTAGSPQAPAFQSTVASQGRITPTGTRRPGWTWPLTIPAGQRTPTIVRGFEPPSQRWQSGHRGVDLLGTVGAPVLAAGSGTVSYAGTLFGRPVVAVDHATPGHDTLRTTYEPVDPLVKVGDRVARGQTIGTLSQLATDPGVGHCAPQACLHWGLVRGFGHDEHYLDPRGLLARRSVRLLPIWGLR